MTELNLDLSLGRANNAAEEAKKPASRWLKVTIAFVLSALFPGSGQLYNRQPRRGALMAATLVVIVILEGIFHSVESFPGFIAHLILFAGGTVLILIHACRTAWIGGHQETPFRYQRTAMAISGIFIVFLASLLASDWFRNRFLYIKAFRIPSASMCPTICIGERIIADRNAYKLRAPQRGEIILFKSNNHEALFLKRVIGIAGDTVQPGSGDEILVNGKPIQVPEVCGQSNMQKDSEPDPEPFDPVKVPAGQLFVIGDNLHNSLDSRIPGFGFVNSSQAQAKPLYLYWSPRHSRIGCSVR